MTEPATFISTKWIGPIWQKLLKIRGDRKQEMEALAQDFGDPLNLSKYYIQPFCQHHNPADHDEREPISFVRSLVFETLNAFFKGEYLNQSDGRNQLFILSDAGMGKTSVLLMVKMTQLLSFWPKPYNCSLLKLGPDTLRSIEAIQNKSNTVLLLDALDEDPTAWGGIEGRLQNILTETCNFHRVVVSCRTQFFPENSADPFAMPGRIRVAGFICPMIFLSLFDDEQVEQYLLKRFSGKLIGKVILGNDGKIQAARAIVKSMRSLRLRPLLLSNIEYLIDSKDTQWNEYTIYNALIESWLLREERKLFKLYNENVTVEALLEGCSMLAIEMQKNNGLSIELEDLRITLQNARSETIRGIEKFDMGGRSLLNRKSDGTYRFSHYTIQEFLAVSYIISGKLNAYERDNVRFTSQMLRFLMCGNPVGSLEFKRRILSNTDRVDLRELFLVKAMLPIVELRFANLAGSNLEMANFSGSDLGKANFIGCNLRSVNFSRASLRKCDLRRADLSSACFEDADLASADLRGALLRGADFRGANMEGVLMDVMLAPDLEPPFVNGTKPLLRIAPNLSPAAVKALKLAGYEAHRMRDGIVNSRHLLLALIKLEEGSAYEWLSRHVPDLERLLRDVQSSCWIGDHEQVWRGVQWKGEFEQIYQKANSSAELDKKRHQPSPPKSEKKKTSHVPVIPEKDWPVTTFNLLQALLQIEGEPKEKLLNHRVLSLKIDDSERAEFKQWIDNEGDIN